MALVDYFRDADKTHDALCQTRSLARGCPHGPDGWVQAVVQRLGLQSTMRPRGRPREQQTDTRKAG